MKKALVLGASGGMGYSIVKELSCRGISVIAFARNKERLEKLFGNDENVDIFKGDIFQVDDLKAAAQGVDVIFQSANIPYKDWESKLLSFMTNIVQTAKEYSAKLVLVDNIYAYGRSTGRKVSESTEKNPHTKKGKIRLQLENIVKSSEVEALIAHFPDFYGPNAENTILHFTLQKVVENKKASYVGNKQIPREFIYTPDGAKAIVELATNEKAYGQNWNIPGVDVISGNEIVEIIREVSGYQKSVSTISKNMIRFLGLFSANMREVVEMFYLNEEPVVLDGEKYESLIGSIPRTPYRKGLQETLDYMKRKNII
ncbi:MULTISPECIES: SDR family NAD(P)-dependent oxidoreductase [unclassified Bacillus (in: firmicutes)]|uniref:SDR family NAD(P)-dependent oxidoreductase n=1 Tax=unclassified Bacillus (in: firmicutes) TaxID=185979 RepID=UPI0008E9289E|nr:MULTISPECIES: SDR family NAD(P)-dependent oxidoreductase [unclassified Bacillus (in: firmicutes)]SFB13894.1 Nucleoside-diphosphate-sugar epimerase [Bacillus sp. UNCCL13]SFQ89876.1 Nucleoside-diphosphate-sugar epimerase [Bacillus sp. cl95]